MATLLNIPTLATDRLVLEPLSSKHSAGMFELWSDPAVCEYSGTVTDYDRNVIPMPARTRHDSDRIVDFWRRAAADGWGLRWAVLLAEQQHAFAGTVGFNSITACAEIAYHLLPTHWGNGLMTEAAVAAMDWSRAMGAREIEAFVEPANTASIALAQRLGMTATGEFSDGAQRYLVTLT